MVKFKVKKNNYVIHTTDKMSEEEANIWITWTQSKNVFGKSERWVRAEAEDVSAVLETREVEDQIGLDENDEPVMGLITEYKLAAEYEIENIPEQEVRVEMLKEAGKKAREACTNAYDLISGYNLDSELTGEQVTEMVNTFAPIINALQLIRPTLAKSLINAIVVDGVIFTEQLKSDVLNELKDF